MYILYTNVNVVIKYPIFCFGLVAKTTFNNNIHSVISVDLDIHFSLAFLLKMYSWINLKKKMAER